MHLSFISLQSYSVALKIAILARAQRQVDRDSVMMLTLSRTSLRADIPSDIKVITEQLLNASLQPRSGHANKLIVKGVASINSKL